MCHAYVLFARDTIAKYPRLVSLTTESDVLKLLKSEIWDEDVYVIGFILNPVYLGCLSSFGVFTEFLFVCVSVLTPLGHLSDWVGTIHMTPLKPDDLFKDPISK